MFLVSLAHAGTFTGYGRVSGKNMTLPPTGIDVPEEGFRLGDRVYENEVSPETWARLEDGFGVELIWVMRQAGGPSVTSSTVRTSTTVRSTSLPSSTLVPTTIRTTTSVPVGTTTTLPITPAEPTLGRHRSVRISRQDTCRWWDGQVATQAQAAELHNQWARIFPEGMAFGETLDCSLSKARGDLTALLTRLAGDYVVSKAWPSLFVKTQCNGYSFDAYLLAELRDCALRNPVACAASPYLTDYLAEAIDVRVEGGRCVKGNPAPVRIPPSRAWDSARFAEGRLDFRNPRPPLTATQKALNAATHQAHAAVTAEQCGWGPPTKPGIVREAHLALVASARNEEEKHLFQAPAFSGQIDTDCTHGQCWNRDEVCAWGQIKDVAHHCAMLNLNAMGGPAPTMPGVQVSGFTGKDSRVTDAWVCWVIHQLAHVCAAYRDDTILARFPCDQQNINNCPRLSCADWLRWFTEGPEAFPKVTRKHQPIPWLSKDWRKPAAPVAAPRM